MTSQAVKAFVLSKGAALCGVADMMRFSGAPRGYHPQDVMPTCRSVISFAMPFPVGTLKCASPVPYTRVRNTITPKMDQIALELCLYLEQHGHAAAPIPTNESQWDAATGRWRSIISQKHAAQAAGLLERVLEVGWAGLSAKESGKIGGILAHMDQRED